MRSQIQFKNFSFNIIKFLFALTLFTLGNAAYAEESRGSALREQISVFNSTTAGFWIVRP